MNYQGLSFEEAQELERKTYTFSPCPDDCEDGRVPVDPLGYTPCPTCKGHGKIKS